MIAAGLPRWLAHALVVFGWLLTPLLAWGASFFGMWAGAHVTASSSNPLALLAPALLGAVVGGFTVLWVWVRFMRRVPHLLAHHMLPRATAQDGPGVDA